MKLNGRQIVDRPPEQLWDLFTDPEVLQKCIPGCEQLDPIGDNRYFVEMKVGIGPVKGRFQGTVEFTDIVAPESYRLVVKAKGTTGFINGTSDLRLTPQDGGSKTELTYQSEAKVSGVLASIGARLMESVGKSFAHQFFDNLAGLDNEAD